MEDNDNKNVITLRSDSPVEQTPSIGQGWPFARDLCCEVAGSPTHVKFMSPNINQAFSSFKEALGKIADEKMQQCPNDRFNINVTMTPIIYWKADVAVTDISGDE